MTTKTFAIGDKVRFTGKFLKNTGQQASGEGRATFTITGHSGSFVIVDQPLDASTLSMFTATELAADPTLRFRRINPANLHHVGTVTVDNCV